MLFGLTKKFLEKIFAGWKSREHFLALDVSTHYIKIIEVQKDKGKILLKFLEKVPLEESIQETMKKALIRIKHNSHKAILALPWQKVFSKKITIPKTLSRKKLKQYLEFNCTSEMSLPIENINIDYQVLGDKFSGDIVQLFATSKKHIIEQTDLMKSVGLIPIRIDIDAVAIYQAVNFQYRNLQDYFIFNFAVDSFLFLRVEAGKLLDFQTFYEKKFIGDYNNVAKDIFNIIEGAINNQRMAPDKIFLSGDYVFFEQLSESLKKILNAEIIIFNPIKSFDISSTKNLQEYKQDISSFTICSGLVIQELM